MRAGESVWLVVLGGCGFTVSPGTAAPDASDGPAADGPMIDGRDDGPPPPQCMAAGTMDTFTGPTPCSPWATFDSTGGAMTSQSGGKLRVQAPAAATNATHGGCFAATFSPFGPEGVLISVESALGGTTSYTALTAYVSSGTPATIRVQNGQIDIHNPNDSQVAGMTTYEPSEMKWWRIRPVVGGVIGETSADALTWKPIGTVIGTPPTAIRIDISAGSEQVTAGAGTAVFDNLNVCP